MLTQTQNEGDEHTNREAVKADFVPPLGERIPVDGGLSFSSTQTTAAYAAQPPYINPKGFGI